MGKFVKGRTIYKPVDEVDIGPLSDHLYISPLVKAPRMNGFVVRLFVWILECRIIGSILLYILKKDNLIFKLVSDADIQEPPVYVPLNPYKDYEEQEVKCIETNLMPSERVHEALNCLPSSSSSSKNIFDSTTPNFKRWKIMDYSQAYTSGKLTPLEVADRFIAAIDRSSDPECNMAFFINCDKKDILQQAKESTLRYEQGKPISVLDGVPVAIKDEIDCTPYPTTGGTKWLHKNRVCTDDAFCVKQLRKCGALLVGKTNMHELGAGTSGINPHYGAVKNPYNTSRISGGSSSGSAAVVCAGLCPVALGVDGGGSVRMPAALCGVVGLKPTFGRVPHSGVVPLNWTVGSVGILAATIDDALLVYAAISGEDSEHNNISMPKLNLPLLNPAAFTTKIKLVKYNQWFNDCSKDISLCCSNTLDKLHKTYGWEIVEMTVPDIETMRLAHYITIGCECTTSLDGLLKKRNVAQLGGDTRVALSIYGSFHSKDYLKAQKIRNREMQFHRKIFSQADFIVTPTTGVTAYELKDDALANGELDYINGAALVRYVISGNFLGLPAISIPIGYDEDGLPIGIQLIGKPWSEAALLKAAHSVQDLWISKYKKPQII
ncbi:hypothetical protein V2J09_019796 [Rumex salicifolius]